MPVIYLFKGVLVGLATAMPIGPIGILCIRRTLVFGRKQGITTGLGGAAADIIYVTGGIFGINVIADFVAFQQYWIRLCGGIALIVIGIFTARANTASQLHSGDKFRYTGLFASTFLLAVSNPNPLFGFTAIFAAISLRISRATPLCLFPLPPECSSAPFSGSWCSRVLLTLFGENSQTASFPWSTTLPVQL